MFTRPNNQYLETKIQTATPEGLVVMLYEGAIRFLNQASNAIEARDWHNVHRNIVRAQDIIAELNVSLDKQKGGDIAKNLEKIYDYLNNRLIEANIKKDQSLVKECIKLLSELNDAWNEITKTAKPRTNKAGAKIAS